MRFRHLLLAAVLTATAACSTQPTGVATNPPVTDEPGTGSSATPAPTGPQQSGARTVLSPLGLNVRSGPSTSASSLGAAAQGTQLTVLGYTADNGGWYHVQGATTTGYITADPTLSAAGAFVAYSNTSRGFDVLYPASWTFAEETADVLFRPQSGPQSLVIRTGASVAALGAPGEPGYVNASDDAVVVCGVTGDLLTYTQAGTGNATPASAGAPLQKYLAQIHLKLDATHALGLDFNYADARDLDTFGYFYNSMRFPFPQCEK